MCFYAKSIIILNLPPFCPTRQCASMLTQSFVKFARFCPTKQCASLLSHYLKSPPPPLPYEAMCFHAKSLFEIFPPLCPTKQCASMLNHNLNLPPLCHTKQCASMQSHYFKSSHVGPIGWFMASIFFACINIAIYIIVHEMMQKLEISYEPIHSWAVLKLCYL